MKFTEALRYMNIRHAVENAINALEGNRKEDAKVFLAYALKLQMFIDKYTSPSLSINKHPPAVCCFYTSKDGTIHCGKSEQEPLFPAKKKQRRKICHDCRAWCRERIEELTRVLAHG